MKTIKQWLETLEEPYKTEALNNSYSSNEAIEVMSLSEALKWAFTWSVTNEGHYYWCNLHSINLNSERFEQES